AHWLEVALRLLPESESTLEIRLRSLSLRAKALGVTGRLAESRDLMHELLALLPAQPSEVRAQVAGFCALMDRLLGQHAEARALLLRELDGLIDSDTVATAIVKLELASGRLMRGDVTPDREWAGEAVVIARRLDDRSLLAAALGMCVLNDLSDASIGDQPFSLLDEAAALMDSLPDSDLTRHLTAAVHVGYAEMHLERVDDALRHLHRGLRLARATGQNHLLPYLLIGYGAACGLSGRLGEAGDCFDDALEAAALTGSAELRAMALAHRCWITLWRGDIYEALRIGEEAVACADGVKGWVTAVAHGMLAQARLYANDPAGCVELLLRAGDGPQLRRLDPVYHLGWRELLVEATAAYNPHQAAKWADHAESPISTALPRRKGFGHLTRAWALRSLDPSRSAAEALAAATLFDQAADSVDTGRAYLLAATALEACGCLDQARHNLARARGLFDACGASLFRARALHEERRLNARAPRQSQRSGQLHGLTRRETEVAGLVKQGMTNRQIAHRLYLSPRTVEVHLSHILAKLDITTRSAIAPAMAKAEPPDIARQAAVMIRPLATLRAGAQGGEPISGPGPYTRDEDNAVNH
ncbi:MAG: LuxR C-terminal-related transcriptional regulator, partial [Pseudonocardiaceae bacterium]